MRLNKLSSLVFLVLLSSMCGLGFAQEGPDINIEGGKIQGVATDIPGVRVFKGIPYAADTAGENRFRGPQPVEPWTGVRVADTWGDRAMQWANSNPVGSFYGNEFYYDDVFMPPISEQGLNLNVFTPANGPDEKLPVYMWIHGGANAHGGASEIEFWAPKLADKGIVIVSVQYRLGVFGNLSLPEIEAESPNGIAGNQRLQDLIAALHWIKNNISGFGGDPASVTIGGQSAGATNTLTLLRSPLAKGLFQRAMISSTRPGILGAVARDAHEVQSQNARALEDIFGKPMSLADMREIPAEEFVTRAVGENNQLLFYALRSALGGPVIDDVSLTEESVDLTRPGAFDGIDILIGSTADERTPGGNPDEIMGTQEYAAFMSQHYGPEWEQAYPAADARQAFRLSLRASADLYHQAALVSAEIIINQNEGANAYVYYFDNPPPGRDAEFYGSFHSSELWYFMNSLRDWPGQRPWTELDYRMAETMSTYLANFVKTGNPNGQGLPDWQPAKTGTEFIRFNEGYAQPLNSTPYPERDRLNRRVILETYDLESD